MDEWRRVSHCPANWWAFLLYFVKCNVPHPNLQEHRSTWRLVVDNWTELRTAKAMVTCAIFACTYFRFWARFVGVNQYFPTRLICLQFLHARIAHVSLGINYSQELQWTAYAEPCLGPQFFSHIISYIRHITYRMDFGVLGLANGMVEVFDCRLYLPLGEAIAST